jgi:Viral BACON domain/Pectate lyase
MMEIKQIAKRPYTNRFLCVLFLLAATVVSALSLPVPSLAQPYQGFGADTPGGEGQPLYRVTNLNDSGPGSLRDAVSQGNRTVVFDVGGEIVLSVEIQLKGAFITIDGFTAPSPITVVNDGLVIDGDTGAHDIIVRGIRVRNANGDSITIRDGAHNVVIDHVSSHGANDGAIDITTGAFDITVQWSIFAANRRDNLISAVDSQALRVTFHHNLFVKGQSRNPQSGWDGTLATTPPDTVADIRNNLIWDFSAYGSVMTKKTKANVVNNFYYSSRQPSARRALYIIQGGQVYAQGNYSHNGANIDGEGNQQAPFAAAPVDVSDPCSAAHEVVADAGVKPRDAVDDQHLSAISLPTCVGAGPNLEVTPTRLDFSAVSGGSNPSPKSLTVSDSNSGGFSWTGAAGATWLSVSPMSGTAPSILNVAVSSSGLAAGTHLTTISIVAPDATGSPVDVPVTLVVSPAVSGPQVTTPEPGSVLPGSEVTFSWTANGSDVRRWRLYVGSTRGAKDLHDSGAVSANKTSRNVRRLPTDGRTIWVQLRFQIGGAWEFADFEYTAALK